MRLMVTSFWRAAAYCLHPRVIALSLVPVVVLMASSAALAHFFWQSAIAALAAFLDSSVVLVTVGAWLQAVGLGGVKSMLAPLLLIVAVTPLMVVATLVLVSLLMTPALVLLVARRRFPALERRHGASFLHSAAWALGSSLLALAATVVSLPMWIVPPLVLVLPPVIWGWLTFRVMAFDALAAHASASERRTLLQMHRKSLLAMGLIVGLLGAAPSLLWSVGLMAIAMAPLLVPLSIWVYTLIFVFSSLWFAHFCLDALQTLRAQMLSEHEAQELVVNAGEPLSAPPAGPQLSVATIHP
jgi:hypothetical protein